MTASEMDGPADEAGGLGPFTVHVPEAVLDDLRHRLRRARWPAVVGDGDWQAGTDSPFLQELCRYWAEDFDWRAAEGRLNAWTQVRGPLLGQPVHAVHARSPVPDALPLLITHGWPGSVFEFLEVIGPLVDPERHGGEARDAFHVVCPSLPGFGWSSPLAAGGWDVTKVARAEAALMGRLGYDRFGLQGGDWGAFVSARMAQLFPDRVAGMHLNFVPVAPPDPEHPLQGLDGGDRDRVEAFLSYTGSESAYAMLQGTKPDTLSFALNDSPAGLAGWIVEKFRTWTDGSTGGLGRVSVDQVLANITTYWVTETAGSSARLYYETRRAGGRGPMGGLGSFIDVPTACALFPAEVYRPPRSWIERQYRLERYTEFDRGGHFAALEEPGPFVDDVRSFFRTLRGGRRSVA